MVDAVDVEALLSEDEEDEEDELEEELASEDDFPAFPAEASARLLESSV